MLLVSYMYSNQLIVDILLYIDENINKKITMDEISKMFYFNKDYIMRLFKKELGITIMDYINKKRIYNSLESVKNTDYLMIKIALNNGFFSQEYFCETFTKVIGESPLCYRRFTKPGNLVTEEEYDNIRKGLVELSYLIKKVDLYKRSLPACEVKRFSL